jgi:hypothetical protein
MTSDRLTQFNSVWDAHLQAYEAVLTERNGRKTLAGYYRRMWKKFGHDRLTTSIHNVMKQKRPSVGLKALSAMGKLEWSDEQMLIDFHDLCQPEHVEHAKKMLGAVTGKKWRIAIEGDYLAGPSEDIGFEGNIRKDVTLGEATFHDLIVALKFKLTGEVRQTIARAE